MINDLDVSLDGAFLAGLTEATNGSVHLIMGSGAEVPAKSGHDIRILAHNE